MIELGVLIALVVLLVYAGKSLKSLFIGVEQNAQDWTEEQVVEVGLNRIERLKRVEAALDGKKTASHQELLDKFGIK